MAAFRIREDAYTWLSNVEKTLPGGSIFDLFYFCAIAGLVSGRSASASDPTGPTREMVDYFVNDYKASKSIILAMLVVAELKRSKVQFHEEVEVRDLFRELVGGVSDSDLTEEGTRRLNAYASGGYEFLSDSIEQKPQSSEEFLRLFADRVMNAIPDGPFAGLVPA
jgi:hypothetical protein